MMTKKALLALALPLTISSAFATIQMIPPADLIIQEAKAPAGKYVLKSAKASTLFAKLAEPQNWFNLSPAMGVEGVRSEEVYETLGLPQSEDIIVAVIDSGVDVNHEDLQGKIWINKGEIPNNNIDDDGNGYKDDVFGWNFIGGHDGMATMEADSSLENGYRLVKGKESAQIADDSLEVTRELVRLKKLKHRLEEAGETMTAEQAALLNKVQKEVSSAVENAKKVIATYSEKKSQYKKAEAVLKEAGLATITLEAVRALESAEPAVQEAKKEMLALLSNGLTEARINTVLERYQGQLDHHYNENFDPRPIVKDDYTKQYQKDYGNNDVIGPDSFHGTHVSGIIAAARDNGLGIKGVANNVKIMAIRVVPNGDERDKDVANGILYAVKNGAKIINMSFGKAYSPYKKVVDDAVREAEANGVLLVHAAGNDSKNNDLRPSFPTREDVVQRKAFNNWLEICATSYQKGVSLPAVFTNYGKLTVDMCAPGVNLLSTVPDNKYGNASGTSMASPAAAGVAALALSFDPKMNADELKALLLDTSRRYPKLKVNQPGSQEQVLFSTLSTTGTIVDAMEAVKSLK